MVRKRFGPVAAACVMFKDKTIGQGKIYNFKVSVTVMIIKNN